MGKKWEWKNRILGDFKSIMCLSLVIGIVQLIVVS